jgi:hypothetical protein
LRDREAALYSGDHFTQAIAHFLDRRQRCSGVYIVTPFRRRLEDRDRPAVYPSLKRTGADYVRTEW